MRQLVLFLFVSLLLGGYVALNFQSTTDITAFFPEGENKEKAKLSKAMATSELSRSLVVTVEAQSTEEAVRASRSFEELLRANSHLMAQLSFLEGGPPPNMDRALWELYHPRRLLFLAPTLEQARLTLSDAGLDSAVHQLRERVESPLSTLVTRVAPEDPFLTVPLLLERFGEGLQGIAVEQQRYVADGRFAVLFLGTIASALDANAQREVMAALEQASSSLKEDYPAVRIESSGLGRFAISTQRQIQRDITRISVASVVGLSLLCWVLFRSFRLVYLLFLPIGMGMLFATAVSLFLFDTVHGITFAVGASLIGVCVDYVVHFYAHHLLQPAADGPRGTMRRIRWGLLLGASTTIVGFATLAGSSFPGLRQVAVFSAFGVGGALLTSWLILPSLVPNTPRPLPMLRRVGVMLGQSVGWWRASPGRAWTAGSVGVALSAAGLLTVSWQDSMSELTQADPELYVEDARVRARVTNFDTSKVLLALGSDAETALQVNERLPEEVKAAQKAGELAHWQGVAQLLPSSRSQTAVGSAVQSAALAQRLPRRLEAAGFDSSMFEPYFEYLDAPLPTALSYEDLSTSAAAPLVRSFHVSLGDQVAFTTFLQGVRDVDALARRTQQVPGAVLIDQSTLMTDANRQYRTRTTELLGIGLCAIFFTLWARYRHPRPALAALLPAILSAGLTIAALSALGLSLNLLALTALLMVVSIGVDYGVFLTEVVTQATNAGGDELDATLVGLLISWLSTLFGFGLLALSQQPALRTIGVVAAVGVTCSFLLAPASLVLIKRRQVP